MAVVAPAMDSAGYRMVRHNAKQYSDFTGTTNGTINTQTLFAHGLLDDVGRAITPSRVTVEANVAAPAGFVYEVAASHTTTQADIRSTGVSVVFRARAWA